MYNHYSGSVGNNLKHVQITTKYRYNAMRKEKVQIFCRVSVEEVCKNHGIRVVIIRVLKEHVHMIVDCPRTFSDSKLLQIIKGGSAYLIFRICPNLRKLYPRGHFWNAGYFCCGVGSNFNEVFEYVKNQ